MVRIILGYSLFILFTRAHAQSVNFTEGIIYSKTSFPGHPLYDTLRSLDYEKGDFQDQYHVIQALQKHQQSIKGQSEQEIKDAFFASGMMLLPTYSKMYFSPSKALVKTYALGYNQEILINNTENIGTLSIADRDKENQGSINFATQDLKAVWQKYAIDEVQYAIQKTSEKAVIAGYPCKKIVYTFGGTSRGAGVSYYIINLQPLRVTAWYTDELPPYINVMHPHHFELSKAILKYEVEYDKNKKNRMQVEVTSLEPGQLNEEVFEFKKRPPVVAYNKKNETESGMIIMQVMMYALSLLTK